MFRGTVWFVLQEEVFRQGGTLRIQRVQGALWKPLVLTGVHLNLPAAGGGQFDIELDSLESRFAWYNLVPFFGRGRFWESLSVRGDHFDWAVVPERVGVVGGGLIGKKRFSFGDPLDFSGPAKVDLQFRKASVRSVHWEMIGEGARLQLSVVTPGKFLAEKLDCRVKGWSKTFRDLESRAALQGNRLHLAPLVLVEGIQLTAVDIGVSDAVRGRLDLDLNAEAFGGEIRVHAQANPGAQGEPLETSGAFSNLGIAPLAAFMGIEAAGGVLQQGNFSFRGQPSHPSRGSATLRVEASNFQWESRQWDSLVVGATLVDRRIQVPEFSLRQGQNGLVLNGEMQWPAKDSPWWKSDFGLNVTAQVGNLTELSALLLPEFTYVAGALTVDGAVRSQGGVLGGALIVTGSKLTWRTAPIDELHAALKLQGKELELLNVELARGADFLRGRGTVHVGDQWTYQGECKGHVGELARYASLLEPPLKASMYGGGAQGEWSGKGSLLSHEGALRVQFQNVRPLKDSEHWPEPVSGEIKGSYGPEGWVAEGVHLETSKALVRGGLRIKPASVHFESVRVESEGKKLWEGSFVVPREFIAQWPVLDWRSVMLGKVVSECDFSAHELALGKVASFPGTPAGLEGALDGQWKWKGSRAGFSGQGALKIRDFACGQGENRVSSGKADLELDETGFRAQNLEWDGSAGHYIGYAHVRLKSDQEPVLDIAVSSRDAVWRRVAGLRFPLVTEEASALLRLAPVLVKGSVAWSVSGSTKMPLLKGELSVREIDFGGVPDLRAFWSRAEGARRLEWGAEDAEWADWKIEWKINGTESVKVTGTAGAAHVQLAVGGTAAKPEIQGEVRLALSGAVAGVRLDLEPLLVRFSPNVEPELEIRAKGKFESAAFSAFATGSLGQPKYEYSAEPPLTVEKLRSVFEEGEAW